MAKEETEQERESIDIDTLCYSTPVFSKVRTSGDMMWQGTC